MKKIDELRDRVYSEEDSVEVRRVWAQHNQNQNRKHVVTANEFMKMKQAGLDTENYITLGDFRKRPIYRTQQEELSDKDKKAMTETRKQWL